MKPQTLDLLKCPLCNTGFNLEAAQWAVLKDGQELTREVMKGRIVCGNGHAFPIEDFILRFDNLMPDEIRKKADQRGVVYKLNSLDRCPPGAGQVIIPDLTAGAVTQSYFSLHPILGKVRRIAEIGCGDGYWSVLLRKCGWDVIGIDPSFTALRIAKENTINEGLVVEYICGTENLVRFKDGALDGKFSFANLNPPELHNDVFMPQPKALAALPAAAQPQPVATFPCGAIWKGRTVGQIFRCPKETLRAIEVMMSTYNRVNKGIVTFHLRARGSKRDLVRIPFPARQLRNNSFKRFGFPPIKNAKGKWFYFFFTSPQPTRNQGVTALANKTNPGPGSLTVNHRRLAGSLVFRAV